MVNLSKSNIYIAVIAVFAFISFFVLDNFSISTGDDLGYMFTDSQLHNGDGHPISGILECVSTQASHYSTTNGRFIVHLLTSFFVSIPDITVFRLFNSLMFTLLWSGVYF